MNAVAPFFTSIALWAWAAVIAWFTTGTRLVPSAARFASVFKLSSMVIVTTSIAPFTVAFSFWSALAPL